MVFLLLYGAFSVQALAYSADGSSLIDESSEAILGDFLEILPEGMESVASPTESADAVGMTFLIECIIDTLNGNAGELTVFLLR